jgi:putative ABC transport system permease protein
MTMSAALRLGVRRLWKYPAHSGVAVLTLALGIGLTTVMYAIVDGTFLRGLPFAAGDRIFRVERSSRDARDASGVFPFQAREFAALCREQTSFDLLAAWCGFRLTLSGSGEPAEPYNAGYATADLFAMTGVHPLLGRALAPEDERPGAARVVLLSGELWRGRFGGDPGVLGRTVRVSGEPATIVGVMPVGFRFPLNQFFWLPLRLDDAGRLGYPIQVVGRLKSGISPRRARGELRTLVPHLAVTRDREGMKISVVPFVDGYVDADLRSRQFVMLGAVFGVLLIACVNVANLLLARSAERTPEMAVRAALGAGRGRVAGLLLAESAVLAAVGGGLGLGIAEGAIGLYRRLMGDEIPSFWVDVRLDARVFLFALGLTLLASLIAGLLPALQAARTEPGEILKDQSRGSTSLRLGRFVRVLAVAEIALSCALSCALLVPTGLTVESLVKLARLDPGFPPGRVLTAQVSLDGPGYEEEAARRRYYGELGRRLDGLPGAPQVAFASALPLGRKVTPALPVAVEGSSGSPAAEAPAARWAAVSPQYFGIFGLRRLAGRTFLAPDRTGAPPVAVVSRGFAARFFPGRSPLGRRIHAGGADLPWRTVVGVVSDLPLDSLAGEGASAAMYFPWDQMQVWGGNLVLRTAGPTAALASALRREAVAVDPEAPVWALATMEEYIGGAARPYTRAGALFGLFGAVGLFLAALGLYGVMAFAVARRTREIGVRLALGAKGSDVRRLVLRAGVAQLAAGIVLGLGLAAALARLLAASLYQVRPWDPGVYALAPAVLIAAGLLACLLPARRAARIDPMESLRSD